MKKLKIAILIFCLTTIPLGGCGIREEANAVPAEKQNAAESSQENAFSGRAEADETVDVVSKQSGKVSQVYVDIGSEVVAGQALFQLDSRDLLASIDVAKASLDSAQVSYGTARDNQERAQMLQENGAMAYADYENNYLNVLERSEAAVALAEATLDRAEIAYEDSIVSAPISGTVTSVNIKAGEVASAQITSVTIINLDKIKVKLYVSEKKINSLAVGQNYQVEFSAIPGKSFTGTIASISEAMDTASKGYMVNITLANSDHEIKDGMFARVSL